MTDFSRRQASKKEHAIKPVEEAEKLCFHVNVVLYAVVVTFDIFKWDLPVSRGYVFLASILLLCTFALTKSIKALIISLCD